ncbi:MAG: ribosome biogenesis GTP-binding protein YihA/YsxC [Candidatus Latescibacterota bacterium]
MLSVDTVDFVGSFGYPQDFPREAKKEIAFFGRSNVGKSTLINTLLGRRKVARTSKTPGKTRSANYFRINNKFFLIDMPGYGYAKVPLDEKKRWQSIIANYLQERDVGRGVVQLIDIRRDPTAEDIEMSETLRGSGRRLCVVFNKVDKCKRAEVEQRIAGSLGALDMAGDTAIIPFSSKTGLGKRQLWLWIEETLRL